MGRLLVIPSIFPYSFGFSIAILCIPAFIVSFFNDALAIQLLLFSVFISLLIGLCAIRGGWVTLIPVFPTLFILIFLSTTMFSYIVLLQFVLTLFVMYASTGMPPFFPFYARLERLLEWCFNEKLEGEYIFLPSMFGWDDDSTIDSRIFNTLIAQVADKTGRFWDIIIVKGFPRIKVYF